MTNLAVHSLVYVLDACALIAFLRREPGAEQVDALLADLQCQCMVHAINLCEVYYDVIRADNTEVAEQVVVDLLAAGIQVREDMDPLFWQQAGQFKVNPGRLALADCFALALAVRTGATLVTSDRQEFEPLELTGLCPLRFIR